MPVALITGASTGIGRELSFLCAQDGYDVALVARTPGPLQVLAEEIRQRTGRTAYVFARDLSESAAPHTLFDDIVCTGLKIDTLINNAGFGLIGKFWELSEDEQMQMVHLNIGALTQLSRLFMTDMVSRRSGQILNVASTAAFQPGPLMSVYYASKAYVVSFSEAIRNEAKDFGIKVTCLCPGPTKTEFDKRAGMAATKLFEGSHVMSARAVAEIGWRAMKAGKPLVIPGRMNAAMAFLTRFASRQLTASMARKFQEVPKAAS